MPITKSAKKKQRQDVRREASNLVVKNSVKKAVKSYRTSPSEKGLAEAFRLLDIAGKKAVYHSNKVSRLKSRLSKLLTMKKPAAATKPVKPKAPSKKKATPKKTA